MQRAGRTLLEWRWRDIFRVIDSVMEDCSRPFCRIDEEFYGWERRLEEISSSFEECRFRWCREAFGVFVLTIACRGLSFPRGRECRD
jgi:hypothetical protein